MQREQVAKVLGLSALALALSAGPSLAAQASPPASSDCVARETAEQAQEKQDTEILKAAVAAVNQGGFPALQPHVAELEQVLGHAPDKPETTTCDGSPIARGESMAGMLLSAAVAAKSHPNQRTVVLGPSPYPIAALLIGSWYVENHDLPRAQAALSKGLALSPTNPKLTSEDALVLTQLGRPADAVALCDRTLTGNPLLDPKDHARILRNKGLALGDLDRFDEAEAAYRESLTYEPNHATALNELNYLAQRKAGAAKAPLVTMTGDKAATTPPGH
jgi:Flp pilus assembly protein TadD